MKHIFYVIYILCYTGAVFVAGMFLGQMLERAWSARERVARSTAPEALRAQPSGGIPISDSKVAMSGKQSAG